MELSDLDRIYLMEGLYISLEEYRKKVRLTNCDTLLKKKQKKVLVDNYIHKINDIKNLIERLQIPMLRKEVLK